MGALCSWLVCSLLRSFLEFVVPPGFKPKCVSFIYTDDLDQSRLYWMEMPEMINIRLGLCVSVCEVLCALQSTVPQQVRRKWETKFSSPVKRDGYWLHREKSHCTCLPLDSRNQESVLKSHCTCLPLDSRNQEEPGIFVVYHWIQIPGFWNPMVNRYSGIFLWS
jgi:hypothetical protein